MYWSYFAGADPGGEAAVILHRWSNSFVVAVPADSGLYLVLALPEFSDLPWFRRSLEKRYLEYIGRCDPVARALSGARRVGKLFGMLRWEGSSGRRRGRAGYWPATPVISRTPHRPRASRTRSGRSSPWRW